MCCQHLFNTLGNASCFQRISPLSSTAVLLISLYLSASCRLKVRCRGKGGEKAQGHLPLSWCICYPQSSEACPTSQIPSSATTHVRRNADRRKVGGKITVESHLGRYSCCRQQNRLLAPSQPFHHLCPWNGDPQGSNGCQNHLETVGHSRMQKADYTK